MPGPSGQESLESSGNEDLDETSAHSDAVGEPLLDRVRLRLPSSTRQDKLAESFLELPASQCVFACSRVPDGTVERTCNPSPFLGAGSLCVVPVETATL